MNIDFPFFTIYSGWSLTIFMDAIWWQQHLHNSQSARSRNGYPRVSQLALVVLLITSAGRLHPGRGRRGRRRPPTVIATPTPTRPLKPGGSTPQFTGVNRTRYLRRSSWVLSSIWILPSGKKWVFCWFGPTKLRKCLFTFFKSPASLALETETIIKKNHAT